LKDQNLPIGETTDDITISRLALGPSRQMTSWKAYDINGYMYYTYAKDSTCVNQNSGVRIEAINGVGLKIQFFGDIEDIWELDYGIGIQVALFRCCWIKQRQVNDVAQVFYLPDPQTNLPLKKKTKHVVAFGKQHIIGVDGIDDVDEYNNYAKM
jgi:hypothetical protein